MTQLLEADHLVVGAGAAGLAFVDALVEHDPEARVVLVDRRDGVGGHWRAAYPFVRLHQSSTYYGVASTLLGGDRLQTDGPEAGLHERADQPTILAYYAQVRDRLLATGRVQLFTGCDFLGGRTFASLTTGERFEVRDFEHPDCGTASIVAKHRYCHPGSLMTGSRGYLLYKCAASPAFAACI